jgi:hypothetical protein
MTSIIEVVNPCQMATNLCDARGFQSNEIDFKVQEAAKG